VWDASTLVAIREGVGGLRDEGVIREGVRFQVCLPGTGSAVSFFFANPDDWPKAHAAYHDAIRRAIELIVSEIPPEELIVQFDFAQEFVDMAAGDARSIRHWPEAALEEKIERHSLRMSNEAKQRTGRRLDYVHMPVVREPDESYFAPLADLDIGDTDVYVGLIHHTDGVTGFVRRVELARRHLGGLRDQRGLRLRTGRTGGAASDPAHACRVRGCAESSGTRQLQRRVGEQLRGDEAQLTEGAARPVRARTAP
jgi:hypothetical protein